MMRSRSLFAIAMIVGALVGLAAYAYGAAGDRTPTARVQMVLDEDQTGWPFYAAIQEEAEALIAEPALIDAARTVAGTQSGEVRVERPGDLSIFSVVATDSRPSTAIALAEAAASELTERSRQSRRSTESGNLTALEERAAQLDADLATASRELDGADPDGGGSEIVIARTRVETVSRELNDVNRAISDLESAIDQIGPAYRALGPAQLDSSTTNSLLTAITAAAAAAVLSLLALSFVNTPTDAAPPAVPVAIQSNDTAAAESTEAVKSKPSQSGKEPLFERSESDPSSQSSGSVQAKPARTESATVSAKPARPSTRHSSPKRPK